MSVEFEDNSIKVKSALEQAILKCLHDVSGELVSSITDATPVDTGQLKGSWNYIVDEYRLQATIGSPLENAIWTEFGTGEHALKGNGRKGGWKYVDSKGKGHFTYGKRPQRVLHRSFITAKPKIIKRFERELKVEMKEM